MEVYPLRQGYVGEAKPELTQAFREIVPDWDGTNWATITATLLNLDVPRSEFENWSEADIYQYFKVGQRLIPIRIGGKPYTTTNSFEPIQTADVAVHPLRDLLESGVLNDAVGRQLSESAELKKLESDWAAHQLAGGRKKSFGQSKYNRLAYLKNKPR